MHAPCPLTHWLLPAGPAAHALLATDPPLTRAELARDALHLAAHVRAHGARTWALWFEDAALLATALFACWRAGATAVLAADVQRQACAHLDAQVDGWLSDAHLPHVPAARQWRMPLPAAGALPPLPARALDPDVAVVLHTSGSSGAPKHIRKPWWQLLREVDALQRQWPLTGADGTDGGVDCVLGSVSAQHMYGLPFRVLWPLSAGVPLDRVQRPWPEALQHASRAHARCVWVVSPALLRRLGPGLDWAALRGRVQRVYCAGGVLPPQVPDSLLARLGLRPTEIYGSSETGVIAWRRGADDWQPFADVRVALDARGALCVQAPWVQPGQGQTADAARLGAQGFALLGRLDRIVKVEGKRIALPMLEQALAGHPYVAQAHAGCTDTAHGKQGIAALVALSDSGLHTLRERGRAALVQALRQGLHGHLEPLAVPRIWRFFEHLPLNAQGKLTQATFRQAVGERPHTPEWHRQPTQDALERCYDMHIPCDLVHFGGHFPGLPVVPGVVQIGWAMSAARADLLATLCPDFRFGGMEALKFQRLLRPHDAARLHLRWDAQKRKLHFTFQVAGQPCSTGRILAAA